MNRRNWRMGVYLFMVLLLLGAGGIMYVDATEAKSVEVALLQNSEEKNIEEVLDASDGGENGTNEVPDALGSGENNTSEVLDDFAGAESTEEIVVTELETPSMAGKQKKEMRAVWIYYLEMFEQAKSYDTWKAYIDETFDVCKAKKMNTVIFQVRPCADAMYPSKYFPWSKYATGTAGVNPGFDPLKYAVKAAHARGLEIHAWINPYRITLSSTKISELPKGSIVRKWAASKKKAKKRNVLTVDNAFYFNPASSEVRKLVANGVKELVKNYNIDGIHMDDYFYPSLGTTNYKKFDYSEYETYVKKCKKADKSYETLVNWRRSNVNKMVKKVYATVKKTDKNCIFGISPAGSLKNLYDKTRYYSDVKLWMNSSNYIDYICPQIYWSFTHKTAPYKEMVDEWTTLPRSGSVELYIGLAGYRAGIPKKEAKAVADVGWSKSNTILKRQVEYNRASGQIDGFCLFSYGTLTRDTAAKEMKNLQKILN